MILYLLGCSLFMVLKASFSFLDGRCTNCLLNAHQSTRCCQIQTSSGRNNQLFRSGERTLKRMDWWS
uniref:Secreted protein n=1 Tax=Arundo donax TaxID=35708 RepID=A0A0A9HHB7_ARUDO